MKEKKNAGFGILEKVVIGAAIVFVLLRLVLGGHGKSSTSESKSDNNLSPATAVETSSIEKENSSITIDTGVIYDNNGVKISVTGAEDAGNTLNISFLFESQSDLDLTFYAHAYSVNGIMANNSTYEMETSLPAGKKANNTLEIPKDVLSRGDHNLSSFMYSDVLFWAYDDAKNYLAFETDILRVKSDSDYETIEYSNNSNVYNSGGLDVGLISLSSDTTSFSVINHNETYITFDVDSVSVNGFGFDTGIQVYDAIVFPDSVSLCEFSIDDSFKEKNGVNEIETVEFKLNYRPSGDHFNEQQTGAIVLAKET